MHLTQTIAKNYKIVVTKAHLVLKPQAILALLLVLINIYFLVHTIYGSHGIISYFTLSTKLSQKIAEATDATDKRLNIEKKVKLVRAADKDFVDEKMRNSLGLAKQSEKVFSVNTENNTNSTHTNGN